MCGGNKVKERANALAQYQQRNKKSSNDFSDIRDPTLRARMQASAQYLGNNRSKGKSGRSSRTTKGKSGSKSKTSNKTKKNNNTKKTVKKVNRTKSKANNNSSNKTKKNNKTKKTTKKIGGYNPSHPVAKMIMRDRENRAKGIKRKQPSARQLRSRTSQNGPRQSKPNRVSKRVDRWTNGQMEYRVNRNTRKGTSTLRVRFKKNNDYGFKPGKWEKVPQGTVNKLLPKSQYQKWLRGQ